MMTPDHNTVEVNPVAMIDEATKILAELDRRERQRHFYHCFPDETHDWKGMRYYARNLYPKHLEFFAATGENNEVGFMAANRVGKTFGGGYAMAVWLTGEYPDWWDDIGARRFPGPITAWAAGKTNQTTRDIIQATLCGRVVAQGARRALSGTGMIPGKLMRSVTWKAGQAELIDTLAVEHVPTGGTSYLGLKSYEQGRGSFEGTSQHVIWCDEEPPSSIYSEAFTRTTTTSGLMMATFTPLEGMSEVAMRFLPQEETLIERAGG